MPGNLMLTDEGTPTLDVLPDRGRQPGRPGAFDLQGLLIETFNDWKERSGHNVYPAEIEGIVNDLPAVLESAVIGVPHPDFGEVVVAVVVAKDGCVVDAAEVINTLKSKIANFKVPKQVFVVSELPRNTMGKVQKNLLRDAHKGLFGK